jgi:hypothetical protein
VLAHLAKLEAAWVNPAGLRSTELLLLHFLQIASSLLHKQASSSHHPHISWLAPRFSILAAGTDPARCCADGAGAAHCRFCRRGIRCAVDGPGALAPPVLRAVPQGATAHPGVVRPAAQPVWWAGQGRARCSGRSAFVLLREERGGARPGAGLYLSISPLRVFRSFWSCPGASPFLTTCLLGVAFLLLWD